MRLIITSAAAALSLASALPAFAQTESGAGQTPSGSSAAPGGSTMPYGAPPSSSTSPYSSGTPSGSTTPYSSGAPAGSSATPYTGAPTGTGSPTTAQAPSNQPLSVGLPVKDKTGAVIGQITDLKAGPGGQQATVKMGDQSFAIGSQSFVVINGAAVINATQDQLKAMIANAKPG